MRALAFAAVLFAAADAAAFPTGEQFDFDPTMEDGAGGIAFTGAPRWSGHTCAVCHTDAPGLVGIRLESDQPDLFTKGWKANTQYHLRVVMTGDHAGAQYKASGDNCGGAVEPYRPCDENGFAIELDDAHGAAVGKLAVFANGACVNAGMPPTDADARILKDGSAATHTGAHDAQTAWDLCWTAPAAGAGPVVAYIAVVDGNGGNGTEAFPTDTTGDDVASGAVPIAERGAAPPSPQSGGCAATGESVALPLVLVALLALVRRRKLLAAVLAISAASGCVHVRPRQRETLAKRNMKFAPDPAEDELDLHMQESREGSSGGYGSSGGGCGCN